jgi:hypothetical protein
MIHLLGAITLCVISVRSFTKGKKIYVEEKGITQNLIALAFALIGVTCIVYAYEASKQFVQYMGW